MKPAFGLALVALVFTSVQASTLLKETKFNHSDSDSTLGLRKSWNFSWDASGSGESCDAICPKKYEPVCGSDGVTYANDCAFSIAQCRTSSLKLSQVGECAGGSVPSSAEASKSGSAAKACPDACIDVYDPVSDENGKTYSNECYMRMAKCKQTKENVVDILADGIGSLFDDASVGSGSSSSAKNCTNVCPDIYSPVCGSDGVTYSSVCHLELASCKSPKLVLVQASEDVCAGSDTTQQQTVSKNVTTSTKTPAV
ncbi:Kazal-like serine protease inhibitor [Phytophthora megakarya]|uniref:Kazal-like serine protease inhibitor n=1 Tax=Phytophthora megakarya TaxID=4795 RepID=A0A225WLF8_9STRA|nr:Kazal-like serine protease inhibitor [Phytophthora megakarya]